MVKWNNTIIIIIGKAGLELDRLQLNASGAMDDTKTTPFERRFNPYDFNGG